jgi:hypothetical protein
MRREGLLAIAWVAAVAGCGARSARAPEPDAFVALSVEPPEATVRVDDRVVGSGATVRGRWIAVHHGAHRLAVNAPGFDRHEQDLELAPGRHTIVVRLLTTPER